MIGEQGPPHQKTFTWQLTLGEVNFLAFLPVTKSVAKFQFSTTGTGPNKKLARNVAAEQVALAPPPSKMTTVSDDGPTARGVEVQESQDQEEWSSRNQETWFGEQVFN